MIQRRSFSSAVLSLEERMARHHLRGVGEAAVFEEVSLGWWVRVAGSSSLYMGGTRPSLSVGDLITLAIEWVET